MEGGATEQDIHQMLVVNPARMLTPALGEGDRGDSG